MSRRTPAPTSALAPAPAVPASAPTDLRDFIQQLRDAGELHEVTAEVDCHLEITEIVDRTTKEGGPALLFTNVRGHDMPVLVNQFGSDRRLAIAFGVEYIDEVARRIEGIFDLAQPARGLGAKLRVAREALGLARMVPPRMVPARRAPCQQVVHTGDDVDLTRIPILGCWPEDGGPYITLPLVFTKDRNGMRNCGMYRVQRYDERTCGMHWQIHKDGADDWRHMPPSGRLEVAVAIGTDPIVTYSASCPLPKDIDEMLFAGFARGRRVDMVQCRTIDMQVPANAEVVIEGYITQGELRTEGPFGDHTGYYSLADEYPVLHVTAVTHRSDAIWSATIVGVPDHEDRWMGQATERIFLPLLQKVQHEIVDYDLPSAGVFHGCCIVALRKTFPGHAKKVMHAIWGTALLSLTKTVIVVDADIDVHDYAAVAERLRESWDPARDCMWSEGPIDVLDHAPSRMGLGSKLGIDATRAWASEGRTAPAPLADVDLDAFAAVVRDRGIATHHVAAEHGLAVIGIDADGPISARDALATLQRSHVAAGLRVLVAIDAHLPVDDLHHVAFRTFGNVDPARDALRSEHDPRSGTSQPLAIDATTKDARDGYDRDWPADIVMTEAIKQRVDERWAEYGIPTPGARTLPLRGLAEGERRITPGDRAAGRSSTGNADMARDGAPTPA